MLFYAQRKSRKSWQLEKYLGVRPAPCPCTFFLSKQHRVMLVRFLISHANIAALLNLTLYSWYCHFKSTINVQQSTQQMLSLQNAISKKVVSNMHFSAIYPTFLDWHETSDSANDAKLNFFSTNLTLYLTTWVGPDCNFKNLKWQPALRVIIYQAGHPMEVNLMILLKILHKKSD